LEITADGNLVLKANLSSQTDINLTSHHGDITPEVRSLLILNLVITPSLISERPLTIVSFEVLIKEQPLQSKPLGLAITI
jgi:hypothetical protein